MADREYRQQHQVAGADETASPAEHDEQAVTAPSTRFTSRGEIPPVIEGFHDPGPTASDRAYGPGGGRSGQAIAPADSPALDRAAQHALPGKLEPPSVQISTGNAVADRGLACANAPRGTDACFMSPSQRSDILKAYGDRVNSAESSFLRATSKLHVEELLRKQPEKSDWMLALFLDVIGNVAISTVIEVYHALKGGAVSKLAGHVDDPSQLSAALSTESDAQLTTALGLAAGAGKTAATDKLGDKADPAKPEEGTQKAANVAYLSYLETRAGTIYQAFREEVPAGLSDSLLLVLYDAFDKKNHSVEVYEKELSAKLKRFEKSGVGKLGVTKNENFHPISGGPWMHETRAFWVKTPSGRRLGLYQREYQAIPETVQPEVGKPSRVATPFERIAMEMQDIAARPYTFVRYVPIEFEGAAVAMHTAKWHSEPVERVAQTPEEIAFAGVTI